MKTININILKIFLKSLAGDSGLGKDILRTFANSFLVEETNRQKFIFN